MTIGDRIKQRRKELGLTVDEVALKLGKNRATIYRYESDDIENLPTPILEPLAIALQTTPAYLMGWENSSTTEPIPQDPNVFPIKTKKIPMLGSIAAGEPIFAEEQIETYVGCGADINADFCLRVTGDSMVNARIYDGDIVFIRRQPDVENGEIAAVQINNENVTLKRVYHEPNRIELRAENPRYRPFIFTPGNCDNLRILGKAVAFQGNIE